MHNVNTQINMLGTVAAVDEAFRVKFRPGNAKFITAKHWSRGLLREAKITQEFA